MRQDEMLKPKYDKMRKDGAVHDKLETRLDGARQNKVKTSWNGIRQNQIILHAMK